MGCGALLHSAFSPGALSFYELKEGRVHALVRLVIHSKEGWFVCGVGELKRGRRLEGVTFI